MKVLFVDCCISQRGAGSRTRALADAFLKAFRAAHPDAEIETVPPETLLALKPFAPEMLDERDALASVGAWDAPVFGLARQFRGADRVVVAAPFWDLSFPAALRTYIEYISANGLTYHYEEDGCHGDCHAARLVYLTSGGDFEREDSAGVLHWRQLAAMFGIGQFDYVFAGGLDIDPAKTPELLEAACALAEKLAETF
ncbi:MAG: NAD(P)H-dependent oxidoreductase [Oscillospiraceae bacterium]|nr:NAD(P)H-dependent oxidoreductase [Oscillospiraceae bacterium]